MREGDERAEVRRATAEACSPRHRGKEKCLFFEKTCVLLFAVPRNTSSIYIAGACLRFLGTFYACSSVPLFRFVCLVERGSVEFEPDFDVAHMCVPTHAFLLGVLLVSAKQTASFSRHRLHRWSHCLDTNLAAMF